MNPWLGHYFWVKIKFSSVFHPRNRPLKWLWSSDNENEFHAFLRIFWIFLALEMAWKRSWTVSYNTTIIFCWAKFGENHWCVFIIFFLFSFSLLEIFFQMFKSILQKLKLLCTATSIWMMNFWKMKEWWFYFFLRCRFWNIQNIIMICLNEFSNKIIKTSKF